MSVSDRPVSPPLATDRRVGILGAGTMGRGIAHVACAAGHPIVLYDSAPGGAAAARVALVEAFETLGERGRLTPDKVAAAIGRIALATGLDDLAGCGLVVEAISEDLSAKRALLLEVEQRSTEDTVLVSNSSALPVDALSGVLHRPQRFCGMHFFFPATETPLVEVISSRDTDPATAALVFATAQRWGKSPLQVRAAPGYVVNRVAQSLLAEVMKTIEDGGADVATIDAVMREAGGFPDGPFELMDKLGNDTVLALSINIYDGFFQDPRYRPSVLLQQLVDARHLGRVAGRGWYDYRHAAPPPKPRTEPPAPKPTSVVVEGETGDWEFFLTRLERGGVTVSRGDMGFGILRFRLDDVLVMPTDGRLAGEVAVAEDAFNVVLLDLALDPATMTRVALAAAPQASADAVAQAVGLFQAAGIEVSLIEDVPGLIVARTVAVLANEACDVVLEGVASPEVVDEAMQLGLSYPLGPLSWGDSLGAQRVQEMLDNIRTATGEERYRTSLYLRRKAIARGTLL